MYHLKIKAKHSDNTLQSSDFQQSSESLPKSRQALCFPMHIIALAYNSPGSGWTVLQKKILGNEIIAWITPKLQKLMRHPAHQMQTIPLGFVWMLFMGTINIWITTCNNMKSDLTVDISLCCWKTGTYILFVRLMSWQRGCPVTWYRWNSSGSRGGDSSGGGWDREYSAGHWRSSCYLSSSSGWWWRNGTPTPPKIEQSNRMTVIRNAKKMWKIYKDT